MTLRTHHPADRLALAILDAHDRRGRIRGECVRRHLLARYNDPAGPLVIRLTSASLIGPGHYAVSFDGG